MSQSIAANPDRLLPADPGTRSIARDLLQRVQDLPIISPHGHVDAAVIEHNSPFPDPAALLVSPDHYVTRLIHASGVPLDRLRGSASAERPVCWNTCERLFSTPATLMLTTAAATAKLTIKVPATNAPSAAQAVDSLVIKASVAGAAGAMPVEATANANFKTNPKINMTIPVNADAMRAAVGTRYVDGWFGPMFGTAPEPLQTQTDNPITVIVKNADSVSHIVHGNAGFVHGDTGNPVPPGGIDPKNRTLAAGVKTSGYLHEGANGTSESFQITVNTVQP